MNEKIVEAGYLSVTIVNGRIESIFRDDGRDGGYIYSRKDGLGKPFIQALEELWTEFNSTEEIVSFYRKILENSDQTLLPYLESLKPVWKEKRRLWNNNKVDDIYNQITDLIKEINKLRD